MRVKQICLAFFIGVVAFTTTDLVNRAVYTSSLYESLPRFMRIESPCGWFSAVEPECVANYPLLENELADVAQNAPFGLLPLAVFLSVYRWVIVRFRADPIDGETCCRKCHHILRVAGVETGTQLALQRKVAPDTGSHSAQGQPSAVQYVDGFLSVVLLSLGIAMSCVADSPCGLRQDRSTRRPWQRQGQEPGGQGLANLVDR